MGEQVVGRVTTLFLLTIVCVVTIHSKTFKRVTDRTQATLCAVETASAAYDGDQLDREAEELGTWIPPEALCSWKCQTTTNCTAFNWKPYSTTKKCELFLFVPKKCGFQCDCVHYSNAECGFASCEYAGMNITADDAIAAIYFDACAVNMSSLKNARTWRWADAVSFPLTASVIAIRVLNAGSVGGLLASTDYFVTDRSWKVSSDFEDGWMDVDFDDFLWQNASIRKLNNGNVNYTVSDISPVAAWINSKNMTVTDMFFRYRLKRPL